MKCARPGTHPFETCLPALASLLVGFMLAGCGTGGTSETDRTSPASAAAANLFVAPGGTGDCSAGRPCGSVLAALGRASSGQVVEMAAGSYPAEVLSNVASSSGWSTNVVVRPATGAAVTMAGSLNVNVAHVTLRGLRTQGIFIDANGHYTRLENMAVAGSTFISGAHDVQILNSRLGPTAGNDVVKIGPNVNGVVPANLLFEGNEIGPGTRTAADQHIDSMQTHGVTNLTVRRNIIRGTGDSQALQLGQESAPNNGILVEDNFIESCPASNPGCGSPYATFAAGTNVRFLHNTIKGAPYPETTSIYRGNIIAWSTCAADRPMTYNLFVVLPDWGRAGCDPTNVVGTPTYAADGWHLAAGSAGIDLGGPNDPTTDYDGQARVGPPDAGADEYSGAPIEAGEYGSTIQP